jgi:hypothetical protein
MGAYQYMTGKEANNSPTAGTGTPVNPVVEGAEILNLAKR